MLYRDTQQFAQPEGSSRFKLNVVCDSTEGSNQQDVGEIGTRKIFFKEEDIVGAIAIASEETVVFVGVGEIYLQKKESFTLLVDLPCLNFSTQHPITGTFQTVRGCERIVYWADGVNPDRYYNLDKDRDFQTCNDFGIVPKIKMPVVTETIAESGGALEYGKYSFVFELLDYSKNVLLRTIPTKDIVIGTALNVDTYPASTGGKPKTTNSILLKLADVDTRASYIRIIALTKTSGNGVTITAHECGTPIPVTGFLINYRYVGFNPSNGDILVDFRAALAEHVVYSTSLDITQAANRLLRMNLKDAVRDYSLYQRKASAIGTTYLVNDVAFGSDILTEQGDEIKSYGIGYIFDDGTKSQIFHIPGPLANLNDRRIISTRFGPGDTSSKIEKEFKFTLDVSVKEIKQGNKRNRLVVITYYSQVSLKKAEFIVNSSGSQHIVSSPRQSAVLDVTVDGRTAPINIDIQIEDGDGAKYSKTVQLSTRLEKEIFTLKTTSDNLYSPESLEHFRVYNTAAKDVVAKGAYHSSGTFGAYETGEQYLNPANYCFDDSYWGTDINGISLIGTKVRHHRIPCRTLEPIKVDGKASQIGIRFSNIEYPSADIVGHFFVSSTYDEGNRTIQSSGYTVPYNYIDDTNSGSKDDTGRYLHYLPNTYDNSKPSNTTNQNYISLPYLIDHKLGRGRFIKTNGYFNASYLDHRPLYKKFFKGAESNLQLFGKHHKLTDFVPAQEYNLIDDSKSLLSKTISGDIPNRSLTSDFNVISNFDQTKIFDLSRANLNYVYVKTGFQPFPALRQVRYRLLGNPIQVATSKNDNFDVFDGDVYISQVNITNISKLFGEGIGNVLGLILTVGLVAIFDKEQINVEYELIEGLVFESMYNYNRRYEGTDNCNIYYSNDRAIDDVIIRRISDRFEFDGKRDWRLKDSLCLEWYGNNPDYNISDPVKFFYPLATNYDYCSKCLNKYPDDIIYSEVATGEDAQDNFLVFKPLNRTRIPADGGGIVKGDFVGSKLLIRTVGKTYALFPNAQEMQITDATVYLGTGSFLAAPPAVLSGTSSGFAGQQDKLSSVVTPYGVVWVDRLSGAVYLFSGEGISEISGKGMFHFFEQDLKVHEGEFSIPSKIAYNPLWKTIVMSAPKFSYIGSQPMTVKEGRYYLPNNQEIRLSQAQYFDNRSFTLSYNAEEGEWKSFHSYMPNFMYQNQTTMFAGDGKGIWAFNDRESIGHFFGETYPIGIEINFRSVETFQNASSYYYAIFEEYDVLERTWKIAGGVNFDQAWAYNNTQSSGMVNLFLPNSGFDNIGWSTKLKPVVVTDNNSRISKLKNIAIDSPVISKSWKSRQSYYNGLQGYIDYVPINVNYDMEQQQQSLFRDKILSLRLFITNPKVRVTYYFGSFNNMESKR